MKKIISITILLIAIITSCNEPPAPIDQPPPIPGEGECIQYNCTNTGFLECFDNYVASAHNGLSWQEYRDSVLNDPPDTCTCMLMMPSVLE